MYKSSNGFGLNCPANARPYNGMNTHERPYYHKKSEECAEKLTATKNSTSVLKGNKAKDFFHLIS